MSNPTTLRTDPPEGGRHDVKAETLIALAVQHILAERGMSQEELAAKIGARPAALSLLLSGQATIEERDLKWIAAGLGVTVQDVVDRARDLHEKSARSAVRASIGRPGSAGDIEDDGRIRAIIDEVLGSGGS